MTRTWYFLRHAEKEKGDFYNPLLRHQDEPVSAAGRQEAGKLCAFFAGKPIQPVYASAYLRTAQTIEPLARQPGLAPSVDDGRLNEIDNGAIEGISDETLRQEYPEVWNGFQTRTAGFRFPGGETGEEARGRIASLLEETPAAGGRGFHPRRPRRHPARAHAPYPGPAGHPALGLSGGFLRDRGAGPPARFRRVEAGALQPPVLTWTP